MALGNDELQIKISVDDREAHRRLDNVVSELRQLGGVAASQSDKLDMVNYNLQRMNAILARNVRRLSSQRVAVKRVEQGFLSFNGTLSRSIINLGMLEPAVNSVTTILFGWQQYILDTTSKLHTMQIMMQQVSTAADPLADSIANVNYIMDYTKRAPFSLDALRDSFVKLKVAGVDPTKRSMEALVDATAAFGGSDESLKRSSVAIQQLMGKQVVSMEELRQQLGESIPQAMALMAQGMGVSIAELVKLVESGKLAAKPAIDSMLLEFELSFGGAAARLMNTYQGQLNQFKASMALLANNAGRDGGYYDAVVLGMKQLNRFLSSDTAKTYATEFGELLAKMVHAVVKFGRALYENKHEILFWGEILLKAFAAKLVFGAITNLIGKVAELGKGIAKLTGNTIDFVKTVKKFTTISGLMSNGFTALFLGRGLRSVANTSRHLKTMYNRLAPIGGSLNTIRLMLPAIVSGLGRMALAFSPLGIAVTALSVGWLAVSNNIERARHEAEMYRIEKERLDKKILEQPEKATFSSQASLLEQRDTVENEKRYLQNQLKFKFAVKVYEELTKANKALTAENVKSTAAFKAMLDLKNHSNVTLSHTYDSLDKLVQKTAQYAAELTRLNQIQGIQSQAYDAGLRKIAGDNAMHRVDAVTMTLEQELALEQTRYNQAVRDHNDKFAKILKDASEQGIDQERAAKEKQREAFKALQLESVRKRIDIVSQALALERNLSAQLMSQQPTPDIVARNSAAETLMGKLGQRLAAFKQIYQDIIDAKRGIDNAETISESNESIHEKNLNKMRTLQARLENRLAQKQALIQGELRTVADVTKRFEQVFGQDQSRWAADVNALYVNMVELASQFEKAEHTVESFADSFTKVQNAERFAASLVIAGKQTNAFDIQLKKVMSSLNAVINGFNQGHRFITPEQFELAKKYRKEIEVMGGIVRGQKLDQDVKSVTDRYLKQFTSSMKKLEKNLSIDEQMENFYRVNAEEEAMLMSIIDRQEQATELRQRFVDLLEKHRSTAEERANVHLRKAFEKQLNDEIPFLRKMKDQLAEAMEIENQDTQQLKIEALRKGYLGASHALDLRIEHAKAKYTEEHHIYRDLLKEREQLDQGYAQYHQKLTKTSLTNLVEQYNDTTAAIGEILSDSLNGLSDTAMDAIFRQQDGWKDLGQTILEQVTKLMLFKTTLEPLGRMMDNVFGYNKNPSAPSGGSFLDSFVSSATQFIGDFLGVAVSQPKTGALSPEKALPILNPVNPAMTYSYDQIGQSLAKSTAVNQSMMKRAMNVNTPSVSTSKSRSETMPVTVNMVNKSGNPVQAKSTSRISQDGSQQVIDIILNELGQPSDLRDALRRT